LLGEEASAATWSSNSRLAPIVGELTLAYEGLELAADPGLTLTIYTAEPGSPSEEALRLLASWAASQETDPDAQTLSAERRRA
jgi:hypothetical protein